MHLSVTEICEIECLGTEQSCYVGTYPVCFFAITVIRSITFLFADVVIVYQLLGFIKGYFTLNVSLCCFNEILRWLQTIHSLQANGNAPVGSLLLLLWFTKTDILIEIQIHLSASSCLHTLLLQHLIQFAIAL